MPDKSKRRFRDRFSGFFTEVTSDPLGERSTFHELVTAYPLAVAFIERKYGIKIDVIDNPLTLSEFSLKYSLPNAEILWKEITTGSERLVVQQVTPSEAKELITQNAPRIVDVRENWEIRICKLPNSRPLDPPLLDEILNDWPKDTPILLYCHHGVRSLDAGTFLADRGFSRIYSLSGGIEAWSLDVDPSILRYEN